MKTVHKVVTSLMAGAASLLALTTSEARAEDSAATGAVQQAGPFQVTLIAAPQVGRTRFETRVSRDGQPVTDAKVTLVLSMPNHRHAPGLEKLQSTTGLHATHAQYAGTARLMEGTYRAQVIVSSGSDKGTALYGFEARRTAPVSHLGMWHPAGGFEVRLTTEPSAPQSGNNTFRVQVTREGYPVTDAEVTVKLTMPLMSKMGSAEAYAKLAPKDGAYEGAAKLHHGGDWRATITVRSSGATGRATYDFKVK